MPSARTPIGTLVPGTIGPIREVPRMIARPEYVGKERATPFTGSEVKNAETIDRIRVAARLAAQALATVGRAVAPGVTTDELDRIGHQFLVDHGAYPSTLGYPGPGHASPFPKSLCTSVNEVICHGIPDTTVLRDGDIVNVDITAFIDGVHGDNNATFGVGEIDESAALLIERTREALRVRRRARLHGSRGRRGVPLRAGDPALRRRAEP